MDKQADLHIHTIFSDGSDTPEDVAQKANEAGLACIGICDHDTVDGVKPVMDAVKQYGIEVIPGVELSTQVNGRDVHMLGYCYDFDNDALNEHLQKMQSSRVERMVKMVEKLNAHGIKNVSFDEVSVQAQRASSVGRPHLARVMVEKGVVPNVQAAFDKYIADTAPCYVEEFKMTPYEAIKLINGAGGVSVLAHPMVTKVDELIPSLVQEGLGGIEVYYPNNPQNIISFYEGIARKHQLLMTGGSDAHGAVKRHTYIGKVRIPYERVELLKSAAQKIKTG